MIGGRATLLAGLLSVSVAPAQPPEWTEASPGFAWSFPRDHWSHPGYKTEWWYFTGHLADTRDRSRRFGYQFTFFRVGLTPDPPALRSAWSATDMVMGHLAVTDLASGRHVFAEVLYRAIPLLGGFPPPGDSLVVWSRGPAGTATPWTLAWDDGFRLAARDAARGLGVRLETAAERPLVFQGPGGLSRKAAEPGGASLYYSLTRLRTTGVVILDGEEIPVEGTSWMDKEFGSNQLAAEQVGWDWFSLRLDDGRDVMIYRLRRADDVVDFERATVAEPDGTTRYLEGGSWAVEARSRWASRWSGARYPARWRITIPGEDLDVEVIPLVADQENVSALVPGLAYWEGAVEIRAGEARVGEGYVELTGYGTASRPAI